MVLRHMLLFLPIHKRPYESYYAAHAVHEAKARAEIAAMWRKPFDALPPNVRNGTDEDAFWPPWFMNDILGFMKIGSDGGSYLVGEVFLKRKYFRRNSRDRRVGLPGRHEIVYYGEITKKAISLGDNESYVEVTLKLINAARKDLRRRFKTADVWLPAYDLHWINLAAADREMRSASNKASRN